MFTDYSSPTYNLGVANKSISSCVMQSRLMIGGTVHIWCIKFYCTRSDSKASTSVEKEIILPALRDLQDCKDNLRSDCESCLLCQCIIPGFT